MRCACLWILTLSILMSGVGRSGLSQTPQERVTLKDPTTIYPLNQPLGQLKWDKNGFLIHFHQSSSPRPMIWLYTPQGQLLSEVSPARYLTDIQRMTIKDLAVTRDGKLLVATTVRSTKNALASALLELELNGSLRKIIKTDPFTPERIALDNENNIWMLGYDWQQLGNNDSWPLIQKLSPEGKVLVSTLARSLFPKDADPLDLSGPGIGVSDKYFETVGDKVYAWLPGANRLAILALDGTVLRLVNEPFKGLFQGNARFLEIRSLIFLAENRWVVQAASFAKGVLRGYGWFLSTDGGRTWTPAVYQMENPWAFYLIGITQSKEAIFLKLVGPDAGVAEFRPVIFSMLRESP